MQIEYESTLDDVAEPNLRLFFRSKLYARGKWATARTWFLISTPFYYLIASYLSPKPTELVRVLMSLGGGAFVAVITFLRYDNMVIKRINKHISDELGYSFPRKTTYTIQDGRITSISAGISITFLLSDLDAVTDDGYRIELRFGKKGLCVIPKRSFSSPEQEAAFLNACRTP